MIPVTWYLILQLFGNNTFSLQLISELSPDCGEFPSVTVVVKNDSISLVQKNYMDRVQFGTEKRATVVEFKDQFFFKCINQMDADLVLVSDDGLWGSYTLTRDGVDQLLTEIDILLLQQSYGESARR